MEIVFGSREVFPVIQGKAKLLSIFSVLLGKSAFQGNPALLLEMLPYFQHNAVPH